MEGAMLGIVVIVFATLLAPRLGWRVRPGIGTLTLAAVAFALGLALPGLAMLTSTSADAVKAFGLLTASAIAAGAYLLVRGVFRFDRADGSEPDDRRPRERQRPAL
jgi:hypothetical protein